MIPKYLIQSYNHLYHFRNCKKRAMKLSHKYKIFSKQISYILLELYEYPNENFRLLRVNGNHIFNHPSTRLYNDGLALQSLGLIRVNNRWPFGYYFNLTKRGFNFVKYRLLNHHHIFIELSLSLFRKLYLHSFYILSLLGISMITFYCICIFMSTLEILPYVVIELILLGIFFIICTLITSNKYEYVYIDLLIFCKKHHENIIHVYKATSQAIEKNKHLRNAL